MYLYVLRLFCSSRRLCCRIEYIFAEVFCRPRMKRKTKMPSLEKLLLMKKYLFFSREA